MKDVFDSIETLQTTNLLCCPLPSLFLFNECMAKRPEVSVYSFYSSVYPCTEPMILECAQFVQRFFDDRIKEMGVQVRFLEKTHAVTHAV